MVSILQNYDDDKMFPVYGFGGIVPGSPENTVSHCFALNGDIFAPETNGVKGVMKTYYNAIQKV